MAAIARNRMKDRLVIGFFPCSITSEYWIAASGFNHHNATGRQRLTGISLFTAEDRILTRDLSKNSDIVYFACFRVNGMIQECQNVP